MLSKYVRVTKRGSKKKRTLRIEDPKFGATGTSTVDNNNSNNNNNNNNNNNSRQ